MEPFPVSHTRAHAHTQTHAQPPQRNEAAPMAASKRPFPEASKLLTQLTTSRASRGSAQKPLRVQRRTRVHKFAVCARLECFNERKREVPSLSRQFPGFEQTAAANCRLQRGPPWLGCRLGLARVEGLGGEQQPVRSRAL